MDRKWVKKKEFEDIDFMTFVKVGSWALRDLKGEHPWTFNQEVGVRQCRVRVELVDEPVEVIHRRIIDLWERSDNAHHWGPLQTEAEKYGLDLSEYRVGCKRE